MKKEAEAEERSLPEGQPVPFLAEEGQGAGARGGGEGRGRAERRNGPEKHWTDLPEGPSQRYDPTPPWVLGRSEGGRRGEAGGHRRGYVRCVRGLCPLLFQCCVLASEQRKIGCW